MILTDKERQAPTTVEEAEPSHLARYQFALEFIKDTDEVLDVPCGSGYGPNLLSTKAKQVVGIDIHAGAIEHATEFFQENNTKFFIADMQQLKKYFEEGEKFDLITSFEGIEHIVEQRAFLDDVSRLLKPNGYFLISTPRKPHGSPYHTVEFSLESFTEILSESFIIEKMFGQIFTDIFDMSERTEDPTKYHRFNFIALCKAKI